MDKIDEAGMMRGVERHAVERDGADPDEVDLSRRAHRNLVDAFSSLPAHVPGGFVHRIDGVVVAATGSPSALFNEILPGAEAPEPAAVIEAVRMTRAAGLSSLVQLRDGVDDALIPAIRDLGLEERAELSWPAMVLAPLPAAADTPPGLDIRRAIGRSGYEEHLRASTAITGTDPARIATWLGQGIVDDPDWTLLTGYVDGTPVVRSMSFHKDGVVGVYNVGTATSARRRGYGWAATHATIMAGADAGCTVATLQSSAMARSMYEANGFRKLYGYRAFHDPGGSHRGA
jgi:hypothetical protein